MTNASPKRKLSKLTIAGAMRDADAMVAIAKVLDPFDRETQLRVLQSACVMLGDDAWAEQFRRLRQGDT